MVELTPEFLKEESDAEHELLNVIDEAIKTAEDKVRKGRIIGILETKKLGVYEA